MIDLTELPGTRSRLTRFCWECMLYGRRREERERAKKIFLSLEGEEISKKGLAFITEWTKLERLLARIGFYIPLS